MQHFQKYWKVYLFVLIAILLWWYVFMYVPSKIGAGNSERNSKRLCEGEDCCKLANKDNYTCYCSVKCGPRDIGAQPGDNPMWMHPTKNGVQQTQYQKRCFCQQTEKRNDAGWFIKNCA